MCAEFQVRNAQQPMQSPKIPSRPGWNRVACELFSLKSEDYMVPVDTYSDFTEASQLADTSTSAVIEFLKQQFCRHAEYPMYWLHDSGPQFTRQ